MPGGADPIRGRYPGGSSGSSWPQPVRRQSEHLEDYAEALRRLQDMDLLYPCVFTRRALSEALSAASGPEQGPEGPIIVDTDQLMPPAERDRRIANGEPYALRLRTARAVERVGTLLVRPRRRLAGGPARVVRRCGAGPQGCADELPSRRDPRRRAPGRLAGHTGNDLFTTTHVHRLPALLDLPVPEWQHHRLIADDGGKRLSKRTGAVSVGALQKQATVRRMSGRWRKCLGHRSHPYRLLWHSKCRAFRPMSEKPSIPLGETCRTFGSA